MSLQDIITIIQTLGFPIFIALILLYFGYKVAIWVSGLVNDSQQMLKDSIKHGQETSIKILETQDRIADTQDKMNHSLELHSAQEIDLLNDTKKLIERTIKYEKLEN